MPIHLFNACVAQSAVTSFTPGCTRDREHGLELRGTASEGDLKLRSTPSLETLERSIPPLGMLEVSVHSVSGSDSKVPNVGRHLTLGVHAWKAPSLLSSLCSDVRGDCLLGFKIRWSSTTPEVRGQRMLGSPDFHGGPTE